MEKGVKNYIMEYYINKHGKLVQKPNLDISQYPQKISFIQDGEGYVVCVDGIPAGQLSTLDDNDIEFWDRQRSLKKL